MPTATTCAVKKIGFACLMAAMVGGFGCAHPPKTVEQSAATHPPPPAGLELGKTPMGGPSESPTGAGAGGSGAGGYEAGRVAGPLPQPTTPAYVYGVTNSRMSPVASDGSAAADRGHPLAPNQPLVPTSTTGVTQSFTSAPGQMPVNVHGANPH